MKLLEFYCISKKFGITVSIIWKAWPDQMNNQNNRWICMNVNEVRSQFVSMLPGFARVTLLCFTLEFLPFFLDLIFLLLLLLSESSDSDIELSCNDK